MFVAPGCFTLGVKFFVPPGVFTEKIKLQRWLHEPVGSRSFLLQSVRTQRSGADRRCSNNSHAGFSRSPLSPSFSRMDKVRIGMKNHTLSNIKDDISCPISIRFFPKILRLQMTLRMICHSLIDLKHDLSYFIVVGGDLCIPLQMICFRLASVEL
jgi:hypothetical protein